MPDDLARVRSALCRGCGRGWASATTAIRSAPAARCDWAGSRSTEHLDSPATATATSRSTRWPTRCWVAPHSAISAGSSPRPRRRPRGSRAAELLTRSAARVADAGFRATSVDLTIVGARPRLGGALDAMRAAIAGLLELDPVPVSVKASTGNLIGPEGAGRAISARAVAVLEPARDGAAPRHADVGAAATRAAGPAQRRDLQLRPDGLRSGARRQFPLVPLRRPAGPLPALPGLRRPLGHEHHRHRRQDHPGRGRDRRTDRGPHRALDPAIPGRRLGAAHGAAGRAAPRHPAHPADRRPDPAAPRWRPCVPHGRRLDLLPDRLLAGIRPAGPARPGAAARRRTRRGRRVRQGRRARFRALEGAEARRAVAGTRRSGRAGPGGTSSARRCRWRTWARRSTSTPAAWT